MALKVIGAGVGRTGTNSFKLAMEKLGYGKCHHMFEVLENPWHADVLLAAAKGEKVDWDTLFEGYQATCDWPACHFWRELSEYYPDAKVVLNVRDPEAWYASVMKTIIPRAQQMFSGEMTPIAEMIKEIVFNQAWDNRTDDKDYMIARYNAHNQSVRDTIAADRLLEFDPADGWEPLCAFLGEPVPDEPYPNTNSSKEFEETHDEYAGKN